MTEENLPAPLVAQDLQLIARNPAEMESAQRGLVEWCDSKLRSLKRELEDAKESYEIARKNKWKSSRWKSVVNRINSRVIFYQKMLAVLEAGYFIVPPFPWLDVFAIRTDRKEPKWESSNDRYKEFRQSPRRNAEPGTGRYVSNLPVIWSRVHEWRNPEGEKQKEVIYHPKRFEEVDFPFSFVKPQLLDQLSKAMKLKVFDAFGVLPQSRKADPIIIGQIMHPDTYGEPVSFFIGWWLNTSDLP